MGSIQEKTKIELRHWKYYLTRDTTSTVILSKLWLQIKAMYYNTNTLTLKTCCCLSPTQVKRLPTAKGASKIYSTSRRQRTTFYFSPPPPQRSTFQKGLIFYQPQKFTNEWIVCIKAYRPWDLHKAEISLNFLFTVLFSE